jgi:PE family protein
MSFVTTQPEMLSAAAGDVQSIGAALAARRTPRRQHRPPAWCQPPPMRYPR